MSRLGFLIAVATIAALSTSASAHRVSKADAAAATGISIPSLTHGQMAVIRDNLPAIRALAWTRLGYDITTWRLEDYLNLQSFACLWGVVPGSIADEDSPFNECAHAYLAAARALLVQLAKTPGIDQKAVAALMSKIEMEMLANGASLTLCRYSDEPFNTNEIIWPHWQLITRDPPAATMAAALLAALGTAARAIWRRRSAQKTSQIVGSER